MTSDDLEEVMGPALQSPRKGATCAHVGRQEHRLGQEESGGCPRGHGARQAQGGRGMKASRAKVRSLLGERQGAARGLRTGEGQSPSSCLTEGTLCARVGAGRGGCRHPGGGQQGREKGSDSGYISKVEPKGFADSSGGRTRDRRLSRLSSGKNGVGVCSEREAVGGTDWRVGIGISGLE